MNYKKKNNKKGEIVMSVKRRCRKCQVEKPIQEFFKGETCLNGFYEFCHDCIEKALKTYLYE